MNSEDAQPKRGDVWRVDFDPTVGTEIRKTRPAIVISSDSVGKLPIKLVAPVTGWKDAFADNLWHVRIEPDDLNGLLKTSAVDTLQIRGVDTTRFVTRLGSVSSAVLEEIGAAIVAVIEFDFENVATPRGN